MGKNFNKKIDENKSATKKDSEKEKNTDSKKLDAGIELIQKGCK